MRVIFHPRMRRDLRMILDYYDARSETAGDRFFREFEEAVARIRTRPRAFDRLDEFRRRCNLGKFPYHLIYEIDGERLLITVLRHHRRHPGFGLRRKW